MDDRLVGHGARPRRSERRPPRRRCSWATSPMIWPTVTLLPAALVGVDAQPPGGRYVLAALLAWLPVICRTSTSSTTSAPSPWWARSACTAPFVEPAPVRPARPGPVRMDVLRAHQRRRTGGWPTRPELFTLVAVIAGVMLVLSLGGGSGGSSDPGRRRSTAGPDPARHGGRAHHLAAGLAPTAAESVTLSTRDDTAQAHRAATQGQLACADVLHQRIGADTPVTYLSFGTTNYVLENPSTCEFPTSVFLQRSRLDPAPGGHADLAGQPALPDRQARRAGGLGHRSGSCCGGSRPRSRRRSPRRSTASGASPGPDPGLPPAT